MYGRSLQKKHTNPVKNVSVAFHWTRVGVQCIRSLRVKCTHSSNTAQNSTSPKKIDSLSQDTAALHPHVFELLYTGYWS
jgi:hypothetical protein